jgi:thiol:disulfide interchange protein/DsbC/DsbD-like thiol-disulfide interchange protein
MTLRRLLSLFVFVFACAAANAQMESVGDGGPGPVKAEHLTAELVSLAPSVAPGSSVDVGLVLSLEEHWHVYWINAGFAGYPPAIKWSLPDGVTAGPIRFPVPSRLPVGPLMDFGYEDNTALPVKISVASSVKPGPIHLDAKITWLVCREVCIPGKAHMGIDLTVAPNAQPGAEIGALGAALKAIPPALPSNWSVTATGSRSTLAVTFHPDEPVKADDVEFYPYDEGLIVDSAPQPVIKLSGDRYRICLARAEDPNHAGQYPPLPATVHAVLKISDGEGYEFTAPITQGDTSDCNNASTAAASAPAKGTSPAQSRSISTRASKLTVLPAIGLAFLGGIILNLMPCVFPVLFLKGLALMQSHGEERRHMRAHGVVYTLGILVSFWIVVAALLIVRGTGQHIGWGFQLQSPTFIALLASGLFFFALSLAGQFDLGLSLTSVGGSLTKQEGYTGSFFTGVLATIVATPCTAPLMGAAIGYALAQSAVVTFSVFTALALGLATPYLALTLQPAWMRILPRPGAWMETLKHITALPLFATVIWLTWVYGYLHTGTSGTESDHLAGLLLCFLVLAVAGWVLGRWPGKTASAVVATLLVIAAVAIPLAQTRKYVPTLNAPGRGTEQTSEPNLAWQPYSRTTLDQARSAGRPVFIDFTAAWCLSCQVNEKLVLRSPDVEHQLAQHHFTLLRADWTQYSPEITAQLSSLNRSGVPTYVIYPATGQPDVLPELLTKDAVLAAIQTDSH